MEYDKSKLARLEREADAASAVYESIRDRLSEARRREGFNRAYLLKSLSGLHSHKHQYIKDLINNLNALATAADEAGLPALAQQARQVLGLCEEVRELAAELADAERRSSSINATSRRCREFAAAVDGIPQPYRPPAMAPRY